MSDKTCLFCNEPESVNHLLFDCVVAKRTWSVIDEVLNLRGDWNFEFVATFWIANKKHVLTNIVTSLLFGVFGICVTSCVFRVWSGQGRKR